MEGSRGVRRVSISQQDPEVCTEPLRMKTIIHEDVENDDEEFDAGEAGVQGGEVPVPPDGGWGWVVCLASFVCNMILDGIAYTFGVLLTPLVNHFESDRSTVSWVGSLLCGMYMLSGPLVGGLVNRFGNRPVCIAGSIISWAAISASTLSVNVPMLMVVYGVVGGFGLGLIYLPAVVAVGHYFESKRAVATGIAVCGSGVGTFVFAPLSSYLVQEYGWKTSNLIFASFFGVCIICGAVMKPLEIHSADKKQIQRLMVELPDGTINSTSAGLPGVPTMPIISEDAESEDDLPPPPRKQELSRRTRTVSMCPEDGSTPRRIRTISGNPMERNYSSMQLRTLRPKLEPSLSMLSMYKSTGSVKQSQSQLKLDKPFNRKDIFFTGSITNFNLEGALVVKPNRVSSLSLKEGTDVYMSRGSLVNKQLKDSNTVSSVLRSMMDFSLLKNKKFLLVSVSNIFGFLGFYVPFMYLPSLVESIGDITEKEAALVLSVIGVSNTVGRIFIGWLADRPWADPLTLVSSSLVLSALCVLAFPFMPSYALFITLSAVFGLVVAAYISLTSIMLVDLVGIEQLTSSFGLLTMFRGGAAILGPPLAGAVFEATQSFTYSFLIAGSFFLIAGLFSFSAEWVRRKEAKP